MINLSVAVVTAMSNQVHRAKSLLFIRVRQHGRVDEQRGEIASPVLGSEARRGGPQVPRDAVPELGGGPYFSLKLLKLLHVALYLLNSNDQPKRLHEGVHFDPPDPATLLSEGNSAHFCIG